MPRRPPSPFGWASAMVWTGVIVSPVAPTGGPALTIRRLSRSVTSAVRSGRNAIAHGTRSPCAITDATTLGGPGPTVAPGVVVGAGRRGGLPPAPSSGGPNEQPASSTVNPPARAAAARTAGRRWRRDAEGTATTREA